MKKFAPPIALLLIAAPLAHAQLGSYDDFRNQRPQLGVKVGVYMFESQFMRDTFGTAPKFGLDMMGGKTNKKSRFYSDISVVSASKDGNKLFLLPYTLGYEARFSQDDYATTIPYVRLEGGIAYFDYSVNVGEGRISSKRLGPTASAEVGLAFAERWKLSAKYNWFAKYDDLNFNGLELNLSYAVVRF